MRMVTGMVQALVSSFLSVSTAPLASPAGAFITSGWMLSSNLLLNIDLNRNWDATVAQVDTWVPGLQSRFGVDMAYAFGALVDTLIKNIMAVLQDPEDLASSFGGLDKLLARGSFTVENMDLITPRDKARTYLTVNYTTGQWRTS